MKYFLLEVDAEKNWYELDDDNYANRQIALDEFNEFIFHAQKIGWQKERLVKEKQRTGKKRNGLLT